MARLVAGGTALAAALGCGSPSAPDLVLVTIEAVRADRVGGDGSGAMPHLDGLARNGVRFERALTPTPSTLPSVATILSGVGPDRHGVRDDLRFRLRPEIATVAERLVSGGLATAGFPGALSLHGSFGLARGFAVYDDAIAHPIDPEAAADARRGADAVTDLALAWLDERPRSPFFLWVHYADARGPRRLTPDGVESPDSYASALGAIDASIGRLLEGLDARGGGRERLLGGTATQGESLGEHGEYGHGLLAYDTTLRVPLIAVGPGLPAGRRSAAWVSTADIAATLLEAAGLESSPDAHSLYASLESPRGDDEATWFEAYGAAARLGWSAIRGARAGRWKYTASPAPPTLYDVVDDPGETLDRSADEPERVAALAAAYARFLAQPRPPAGESATDRDERIALIGHLPGVPRDFEAGPPDPRRSIRAVTWVEQAAALAHSSRAADGIGALEVLAKSPVLRPLVLRRLGAALLLADRPEDAVSAFTRLEAVTGSDYARVSRAAALLAAGRAEEALALLDGVADGDATLSTRAWLMRGHALAAVGRAEEALDAAERLARRLPGDDAVVSLTSRARAALAGDAAEEARLRQALAAAPDDGERVQTRLALARLLERDGRDREASEVLEADPEPRAEILAARAAIAARRSNPVHAIRLYEKALALRPSARDFHRALASLYELQGRFDEAATRYGELLAVTPDDVGLLVARGAALARAGRTDAAERDYRAALALDPELPEVHYDLALIALARDDDAAAEANLRRAVALDPEFSAAHLELSRLYHRRGDDRSAEHAARAVATSDPSHGLR